MTTLSRQTFFLICAIINVMVLNCYALSDDAREKGFVYLHEVDPSIVVSLRYCTNENFMGKSVQGYNKSLVILTYQAAEALKKVQEAVNKDGYSLVIYDAYRPQQAVNEFVLWGKDSNDQIKKNFYYPRVTKTAVFDLGYIAYKSGHSRGSTVDLTLIKTSKLLQPIQEKEITLRDGYTIQWLDDNTVFMGSSFDLFDIVSHTNTDLIDQKYQNRRIYLKNIMEQHGFENYPEEWWHYTLKNEPYPANRNDSYFDFVIE